MVGKVSQQVVKRSQYFFVFLEIETAEAPVRAKLESPLRVAIGEPPQLIKQRDEILGKANFLGHVLWAFPFAAVFVRSRKGA